MSISVGVRRTAHRRILGLIGEQSAELAINHVLLGTHELERARGHALRTLGGVAHHQHRLAQTRSLLLNATGVGENQMACRQEVMEVEYLKGIDDVQSVEPIQFLVSRLAHLGFMWMG